MLRSVAITTILWAMLLIGSSSFAQTTRPSAGGSSTRPTTLAATTRARHVMVVPPGFKTVTVNHWTAVIEPADEQWVRQTFDRQQPTTLPTTMPSDILARLQANRQQLKTKITTDLALPADSDAVEKLLNQSLEPLLKKIDEVNPPLFYLVSTERRVIDLIKAGWSDPRFYYNRISDRLVPSQIPAGTDDDDIVMPVFLLPNMSAEQRSAALSARIHDTELNLANFVAIQAGRDTLAMFSNFVLEQGTQPLNLKGGQEWLGTGVSRVLACRYTQIVTGVPAETILRDITADIAANPLRLSVIDLLHPVQPADLRPDALPFYAEAARRKSIRAVSEWAAHAPDDAIPRLLAEVRKNPPQDGEALAKLAQQIGGTDIAALLRGGQ